MRNSAFQLYRHQDNPIIFALSSIVVLTGNVNFTDSVSGSNGTAVCLGNHHDHLEFKSMLNITAVATVYFINLVSSGYGGAVYGWNGILNIG